MPCTAVCQQHTLHTLVIILMMVDVYSGKLNGLITEPQGMLVSRPLGYVYTPLIQTTCCRLDLRHSFASDRLPKDV